MLIQDEGVIHGELIDVLSECSSERQGGRAHAVGYHKDEVALAVFLRGEGGDGWVGGSRAWIAGDDGDGVGGGGWVGGAVAVLEDYCQDDYSGCCEEGPGEEEELADGAGAGGGRW